MASRSDTSKALPVEGLEFPSRSFRAALAMFGRRRRFIVDPRFQGRLILAFLVQLAAFVLILALALFAPLIQVVLSGGTTETEVTEAARHLLFLHDRLWLAMLLATFFVVLLAVRISHRIAGPLYRFKSVWSALEEGRGHGTIRLREGDFLKPEAKLLQKAVASVERDRDRLRSLEHGLVRLIGQFERASKESDEEKIAAIRRDLRELMGEGP